MLILCIRPNRVQEIICFLWQLGMKLFTFALVLLACCWTFQLMFRNFIYYTCTLLRLLVIKRDQLFKSYDSCGLNLVGIFEIRQWPKIRGWNIFSFYCVSHVEDLCSMHQIACLEALSKCLTQIAQSNIIKLQIIVGVTEIAAIYCENNILSNGTQFVAR